MDANEYQRLAGRTLIDTPDVEISGNATFVAHDTIHQAAAVGIVAEYVKKGIFHQQGFDRDRFDDLNIKAGLVVDMIRRPLSAAETFAAWNVLGLCGEAGEVAALVDAMIANHQPIDRDALRKELGDVLWYVAALATKARLELGDIMQANIDKLRQRYPDGYTAEASAARVDVSADLWCSSGYGSSHTYDLRAEPCDLNCGSYICVNCGAIGFTTCVNCCADGEEE